MDSPVHLSFNTQDKSYFSLHKKGIHKIAVDNDFSARKIAEIDIIVSEILSNVSKHTKGGELLVKINNEGDNTALELISIDSGAGMAEPVKMLKDGVSTAGTLGQGLGAINRLSDTFQIYSLKDWGTILLSRVYKNERPGYIPPPKCEIRSVVIAKPGETACGDSYYSKLTNDCWKIFVGDGLGHGPEANHAVNEAAKAFRTCMEQDPVEIIRFMNTEVKKTRGLVGTVVIYNFKEKKWRICGVGNIATCILQGLSLKNYMSYNGIIGMNLPNTMKNQETQLEHNQTLIMCSDGIRTKWDIQKYPSIMKYDLSILAAALYKDFARKTDDMSVIVGRAS